MGITQRKEREKLALRRKIIEASTTMFIAEGYEKTSLRKIAKQIEYSPGTIYLHFKNKNELFYTVHEQAFAVFLNGMQNAGKDIENPFERLKILGQYYMEFAQQNPELYDLMFIMKAPMEELPDNDWDCGKASYTMLEDLVKACVEAGEIQSDSIETTAFSILSFMHGMTSLVIKDRMKMKEDLPFDILASAMEEMINRLRVKIN